MNWLTKVGTGLLSFFTGSGGSKTMEMADEAFHTEQEKTESDTKDLASARAMQAAPINYQGMPPFVALVNVLVDAVSRMIRPGVTIWIIGGFSGWWDLPKTDQIDPNWMQVFWIVLTFWFGGRAIMKDIPSMLAAVAKLQRKS